MLTQKKEGAARSIRRKIKKENTASLKERTEKESLTSFLSHRKDDGKKQKIRIGDLLNDPSGFKPVHKISNRNIDKEWIALHDHLYQHGIYFYVRNPNIKSRELYRFVTEELFELHLDDERSGDMNCFVYDDFYPDYEYENQKIAVEECIMYFFEKKEIFDFHFRDQLQLNRFKLITKKQLAEAIKIFRAGYDLVKNLKLTAKNCRVRGYTCRVTGSYKGNFIKGHDEMIKAGRWIVEMIFDKAGECWAISNIQLQGLSFYVPYQVGEFVKRET
jgi:hypothetical protein